VRGDPTNDGGLSIGQRPAGRPVRYEVAPRYGSAGRRRFDRALASTIVAAMTAACVVLWSVFPVAWMWVGSQVEYRSGSTFLALGVTFVGLLGTALIAILVLARLDRIWILVRRAGGIDQRDGVMTRVFFVCTTIAAAAYLGWWVIAGGGPGPQLAPIHPGG
jgi:hypothetical protein